MYRWNFGRDTYVPFSFVAVLLLRSCHVVHTIVQQIFLFEAISRNYYIVCVLSMYVQIYVGTCFLTLWSMLYVFYNLLTSSALSDLGINEEKSF